MCKRSEKKTPLITPEQQAAMQFLMRQMAQGQTPYQGDFNVTPQELMDILTKASGGTSNNLGFDTSALEEMAKTGVPFSQDELFQKQREVAAGAATKAMEQKLAEMSRFGAKYSSPAVAAATREAANVQAQTELGILQQMAQEHALAQQRKLAASQLLMSGVQAARSLGVDAARIYMAGKQFEKGMTYEEFKRMFPDVYQLAGAIFGRNVDYYLSKGPNYVGALLTVIGAVAGTIIAPGAGTAAGASVGAAAGQFFS